tara:strand:- start:791 stop:1507 length:717 start_codon:yes stop_codon:yes gene_type:complete
MIKFNSQLFSIILPTFNEDQNIKNFIENLEKLEINKEIIVIDNNSTDNTCQEIKKTNAKYFFENKQGYGYALKRGLSEAKGDYLITCEPDGTFNSEDLYKFLLYLDKFECVFGTRTSKSMITNGAKMGPFLRYGNIIVAKFLEYMFFGPSITDVGCSFKAFSKEAYLKVENELKVNDSTFQPELMINFILKKCAIVEIPVFYNCRIGYSKITYDFISSFSLGIKMILLIIKLRIKSFF